MALVKLAAANDLKPNQMKAVNAEGKPILLVNIEGTYYAIGNRCTHMACMLSNGRLNGNIVECPCHGSNFDVKTGKVVRGPAIQPEPKYEVKIENRDVMLST
jgi:nitrite reductase/ring-hydroxylating ferredoxin subunit